MPTITLSPQTSSFAANCLPTHRVLTTGLLLATAVTLLAFCSVLVQITQRAELARGADIQVRHARTECESHVLAGVREECRQTLSEALPSR